jgi:hypothetical protein
MRMGITGLEVDRPMLGDKREQGNGENGAPMRPGFPLIELDLG